MRGLRRLFLLLLFLLVAGLAAVAVVRVWGGQQVGPPAAICPGPDGYGYSCATGEIPEYVDADTDTQLYQDDDLVALELPFAFTFYGTEYDRVLASSNGNLQFSTGNASFENECLSPEPAVGMGDMIAPYWDDLDLTFSGWLQIEVVGQAPERVFVVEWDDVPRFGNSEDRVTFEVQLFEGSNDIIFLYEDVMTLQGPLASEATIGIQSEEQGYALQVSCNQYAVNDGSVIRFVHPEQPETTAGLDYVPGRVNRPSNAPLVKKSNGLLLAETLNRRGRAGLSGLRAAWLNQQPALISQWLWADLNGDGRQEFLALWHGDTWRPQLAEMAIIGQSPDQNWRLLWQGWPLARQDQLRSLRLVTAGDVTGDGGEEIIIRDPNREQLLMLTTEMGGYDLLAVPGRCLGDPKLEDQDGNGSMEIIRGRCPDGGRWTFAWDGEGLQLISKS